MWLRTVLFSLFLITSISASAQIAPVVQLVWMGGDDCPPCKSWRKDELPKLATSDEFKKITFSYVIKSIQSPVPSSFFSSE